MQSEKKLSPRDVTRIALLMGVALILSWVEGILPFQIPVPGVKLGLANIVTLWVLYEYSFTYALIFGVLRVLLASFFLGRLSGVVFSLFGLFLALLGMALIKRLRCFSSLSASVAGAVLHGVGQLCAASLILTPRVWTVLPWMGITSAFCGIITWIPFRILRQRREISGKNLKKE